MCVVLFSFFFSSRRRHTRSLCDWSSDVCSSDLIRKKGHGEVPEPGDTDDYEWTGYLPFDRLPQALNPESGLIVTANARVVGPNYKPYLTDRWEEPYRTARIYDLLHDRRDLRLEDMLKVETDTYSYPHVFLAEQLLAAAKKIGRAHV